jgi:hypothetical protein
MHIKLCAYHSLVMHFASFVGSNYEALKLIVKLDQAKYVMKMVTGMADHWEVKIRERGWYLCDWLHVSVGISAVS